MRFEGGGGEGRRRHARGMGGINETVTQLKAAEIPIRKQLVLFTIHLAPKEKNELFIKTYFTVKR